jgi:hypothetical protein
MTVALSDVTLCAADCAHPVLAARALIRSMDECDFGDAILFSNATVPGPFRTVHIAALRSRSDYSEFVLRRLAPHISTAFVLIVQWDGYVLASPAWRSEFQNYDYLGAAWPWYTDGMNVGNGGFSLRSHRLLALTANLDFQSVEKHSEDELICRIHRRELEQHHGIRIAPAALAALFAYERGAPDSQTFGFHGLFNMWRHVEDADSWRQA